jgi:hypothetical protein
MRRTIGGRARSVLGKWRGSKVKLDGAHCYRMNDRGAVASWGSGEEEKVSRQSED